MLQPLANNLITLQRFGLIIVCKADSAGPELLGQFGNQLAWIAISDDEVAARGLQPLADFGDGGVNKGHPTIL